MPPTMQESSLSSSIEMDTKLSDLLCPIRDPTKNWEVNIAATLEEYLSKLEGLHLTFHNGCLSLNFAQAALIIQGSTSVYCKKVEYLCTLCQQMLHIISSERRVQQQTNETCKEKDASFSSSACDDFCPLDDLKMQKGLDLLEDERNYSNKRNSTLPFVPVMLIRLEEREKGHTFLINIKGEVIGNKQDYHLNVCNLDDTGALFFPMSSSEFSAEFTPPDFSNIPHECDEDDTVADDCASEYRPCSPCTSDFEVPIERNSVDVPVERENCSIPKKQGNCDVSLVKDTSDTSMEKGSSEPRRKSLRHAARKAKQAAEEKQKLESEKNSANKVPVVVKPTLKRKPKRKLPATCEADTKKSKSIGGETNSLQTLDPVDGFFCQSFYSTKTKVPKIILKVPSVDILDSLFWGGSEKKQETPKEHVEKLDVPHEVTLDGNEAISPDEDDNAGCLFPEADDHIDDSSEINQRDNNAENVLQPVSSSSETNEDGVPVVPASTELPHKGVESYLNSIAHYCRTDDLTKKVGEWEERIKPILKMESEREGFDIHAYETRLMKNFDDNNQKQTVSFSKICKGKQKWEICRYFLASLQLANSYNIDISADNPASGNDMELTLMS